MQLTGAQMLVQSLLKEGVDTIFGIPGGAITPIYDALRDSSIKNILTRHEQAAVHAADGYARATGKTGVCLATSGPGATNLITGLANAFMDSIPVVALTGQTPRSLLGTDSFQEADLTTITMPITKHNYLVKDPADLPRIIREAFHIAATGRPGPVLVDIPRDVSASVGKYEFAPSLQLPGYKPSVTGHPAQVGRVAKAMGEAKRPIIYAGGGITASGAHQELLSLAEKTKIPVTTTLMGLGGFPMDHQLFIGMLGLHGTYAANMAVMRSDLIIALGARFDDRVTGLVEKFAPLAKVIHVDIDPAEIGKNVKCDIPVVGDLKNVLTQLLPLVKEGKEGAWRRQIAYWEEKHPLAYQKEEGVLKPQEVVEGLYQVTEGKALVVTEVGQHQMWAAHYYRFTRPRSFLTSGGLGAMGFGFPGAIGAKIGRPEEEVFLVAGDGSFQMNLQELATLAYLDLPVKILILNNGYLGMVRQLQEIYHDNREAGVALNGNPDFVKLAEAYGITGARVTRSEEVRPALEKALASPHPMLIDFIVDPVENVWPMVPAGQPLDKLIGVAEA